MTDSDIPNVNKPVIPNPLIVIPSPLIVIPSPLIVIPSPDWESIFRHSQLDWESTGYPLLRV